MEPVRLGVNVDHIATLREARRSREPDPVAAAVLADDWKHAYARELAAFPVASLRDNKVWPPVGRADNVHGDRHLFCACIPVADYA